MAHVCSTLIPYHQRDHPCLLWLKLDYHELEQMQVESNFQSCVWVAICFLLYSVYGHDIHILSYEDVLGETGHT